MDEYAKKEVLIKKLLQIAEDFKRHGGLMGTAFAVATNELAKMLNDEKCNIFEEAKPVVHAHWKEVCSLRHYCSNCVCDAPYEMHGYDVTEYLSRYCPNCGAKMDEVVENGKE